MLGITVAQRLNQGSIRHRGVIDGGALFVFLFGQAKRNIKIL
jgi:hypothetical protein